MSVIQSRTTSHKRGRLRRTLGSPRPMLRPSQTPRILFIAIILAFFVIYTFFPNNTFSGSSFEAPIFEATQRVQYDFEGKGVTAGDRRKANEVKSAMERTFWTYKNHAWGFDEVRPSKLFLLLKNPMLHFSTHVNLQVCSSLCIGGLPRILPYTVNK